MQHHSLKPEVIKTWDYHHSTHDYMTKVKVGVSLEGQGEIFPFYKLCVYSYSLSLIDICDDISKDSRYSNGYYTYTHNEIIILFICRKICLEPSQKQTKAFCIFFLMYIQYQFMMFCHPITKIFIKRLHHVYLSKFDIKDTVDAWRSAQYLDLFEKKR